MGKANDEFTRMHESDFYQITNNLSNKYMREEKQILKWVNSQTYFDLK